MKKIFFEPQQIAQIEKRLRFKYLSHLAFEDEETRLFVLKKGQEKGVLPEVQGLGTFYRREIESGYISRVSIRWISRKVGYGLFAEEKIASGSYFGEYTGVVRRNDRLYFQPLNNYCYEYPVPDSIGRSFVTDATQGNLVRFINHSYRPNLKPMHVFLDGFYHLILIALRDIAIDEQLSYEYGASYWYLRNRPVELQ